MRALLQRVSRASVTIDGRCTGQIEKGFLILLGMSQTDTDKELEALCQKITKLRVFSDAEGKMNLSIADVGGSILLVSQFTLYANAVKGNRPSFIQSMHPGQAEPMYQRFGERLKALGVPVEWGEFGADMDVALNNDGPVTILLEAEEGKIL